jgi:hypothetical protein
MDIKPNERAIDKAIRIHEDAITTLPENADPLMKEYLENKLSGLTSIRDQVPNETMQGAMVASVIGLEQAAFSKKVRERAERGEVWDSIACQTVRTRMN